MMEIDDRARKTFGISPKAADPAPPPPRPVMTEPWMWDFVRGRHSQEEWDAFCAYCQAGPWKRALLRLSWHMLSAFGGPSPDR